MAGAVLVSICSITNNHKISVACNNHLFFLFLGLGLWVMFRLALCISLWDSRLDDQWLPGVCSHKGFWKHKKVKAIYTHMF